MLARTIYEPYAWAIFHNIKHMETVSRPCYIRKTIAIHAAKEIPAHASLVFFQSLLREMNDLALLNKFSPEWLQGLPRGVVLGTVDVVGCVPVEDIRDSIKPLERAFGDYSDGRYAIALSNPVVFKQPVPAKGQQNWWRWNDQEK